MKMTILPPPPPPFQGPPPFPLNIIIENIRDIPPINKLFNATNPIVSKRNNKIINYIL